MADYGLITKNEYGGTQIDSTFQNFVLQERKNVTLNFNHGDPPYDVYEVLVSIPSSSIPPLIAIEPKSLNHYVSILGYTMQGNAYNGMYITTEYERGRHSINFNYIVARSISSTSNESYGMVVYNSNGDICFHSGYKYLKILSVHNITLPIPTPYNGYYPYTDIHHSGIYNPYYILTPNWAGSSTIDILSPHPPSTSIMAHLSVGLKKLTSESVRVGSFEICSFYVFGGPIIPASEMGWPGQFTLLTCTV